MDILKHHSIVQFLYYSEGHIGEVGNLTQTKNYAKSFKKKKFFFKEKSDRTLIVRLKSFPDIVYWVDE